MHDQHVANYLVQCSSAALLFTYVYVSLLLCRAGTSTSPCWRAGPRKKQNTTHLGSANQDNGVIRSVARLAMTFWLIRTFPWPRHIWTDSTTWRRPAAWSVWSMIPHQRAGDSILRGPAALHIYWPGNWATRSASGNHWRICLQEIVVAVRRLHRGSAPQGRVDALLQGRHLHREGQQQAKKTSAVQYIRFLSLRNNLSDYVGGTLPLKYRSERRFAS